MTHIVQSEPKVKSIKILDSNMDDLMLQDTLEMAYKAFSQFENQNEMAAYIKQEMDATYQPTWQCVVGTRFGGSIANVKNMSAYFYLNRTAFLVYKSKMY
jgi:dynein light chain LC8-type